MGSILKAMRQERGITGAEVAELLGISVSGYHYIERGKRPATAEVAEQVAALLGMEVKELFDTKLYEVKKRRK